MPLRRGDKFRCPGQGHFSSNSSFHPCPAQELSLPVRHLVNDMIRLWASVQVWLHLSQLWPPMVHLHDSQCPSRDLARLACNFNHSHISLQTCFPQLQLEVAS